MEALSRGVTPDHPLFLVEAHRIDDERIAVPAADGVAEIGRPQIGWMLTGIGVDHAPRVWSGDVEDEDALLLRDLDDLEAGGVEESRSAGGLTADERGIEVGARLAIVVECLRPRLKRHVSRAWRAAEAGTDLPVALLILRRAETQSPFLRVE
jgi:hypothetical protein